MISCLSTPPPSNPSSVRKRYRVFRRPSAALTCDHRVPISRRIHGGGYRSRHAVVVVAQFSMVFPGTVGHARTVDGAFGNRFTALLLPLRRGNNAFVSFHRPVSTKRRAATECRAEEKTIAVEEFRKTATATGPGAQLQQVPTAVDRRTVVCSARGNRFAGPIPRRLRRL